MIHKVVYTPPTTPGTVSLEMDEPLAQKLRALLALTTGHDFVQLYNFLDDAMPGAGNVELVLGPNNGPHNIDVHRGTFKPEHD